MSDLISRMKEDVRKSGSVQKELFYVGADQKRRVRFLQELDEGIEIQLHSNYDEGVTVLCGESIGESCDYCDESYDDGWRTRTMYIWNVWDVEEKKVKIFMYPMNQYSPLPQILSMYEEYGTIMDRDYVIKVKGKQLDKTVTVIPQDKEKFKYSKKAKLFSKKQIIEILKKAYPDSAREDEDDDSDDDEDIEEMDYSEMSAKELYKECKSRGIKAKKEKKEKYYIALLEEYDEEEDEEDEDDDNEWEDEE